MRSQFIAEEKLGFMESMILAEALERFGDRLSLATNGAIAKKACATGLSLAAIGAIANKACAMLFACHLCHDARCPHK